MNTPNTPHGETLAHALAQQLGIALHDLMCMADRHTMSVQAWLASRAPKAARYQGVGVRASATGLNVPLLNLALGAHFPQHTSGGEVDAEIAAVQRFFTGHKVERWYWWLGIDLHPADMASRLEKHRLVFDRPPLPLMVAALPALTKPAMPEDILVWQATTLKDLQAASTIRRMGFRFPQDVGRTYFDDMPESWLDSPRVKLYLAGRDRHLPVAMGALIEDEIEGLAGVYIMATLPDAQRQGCGKVILDRITTDATAARHRMLILTASKMGMGLYQQFGFIHLFDYQIYRPQEST
jgi:GNAT superfamily N-acetyltransferase